VCKREREREREREEEGRNAEAFFFLFSGLSFAPELMTSFHRLGNFVL
jgi:hypothetical protein